MIIENWIEFNEKINFYKKPKTPFKKIEIGDYFCLYYDEKFVGYCKALNKYKSDSFIKNPDSMTVQRYYQDGTPDETGVFVIRMYDTRYSFRKLEKVITAGIVFIYNDKILLVHPKHGTQKQYSYPKGGINKSESIKDGAIREVKEEIGIEVDKKLLKKYYTTEILREREYKIFAYFIIYLTDKQFKRYFNTYTIPKKNLQLNEIDWAGFVDIEKSEKMIDKKLRGVLNHFKVYH